MRGDDISWTEANGDKYAGCFDDNDGMIHCQRNGLDTDQMDLIRAKKYISLKEYWDGSFDYYQDTDGTYWNYDLTLDVYLEWGWVVYSAWWDDEVEPRPGRIVYFGPNMLIFYYMDAPTELFVCEATGQDSFDLYPMSSDDGEIGELVAKCFRSRGWEED